MSAALSAYELSLDGPQLTAYCEREARTMWSILKSATPYVVHDALSALFVQRPELYTRYQQVAMTHDGHPVPAVSPEVQLLHPDAAREELERLAKQYLSLRVVHDESQALAKAVAARPDLYRQWSQPAAAAARATTPEQELRKLALDLVAKRLEPDEQRATERAIREHPELYEQHRTQVQAIRKVVR